MHHLPHDNQQKAAGEKPSDVSCVDYIVIRPIEGQICDMSTSFTKYWKKRTALDVGHRGAGSSSHMDRYAKVRENTIASFKSAASHGAAFVEFDVHLSKDRVPIVYHDLTCCISMKKKSDNDSLELFEIPVKELTFDQLQLLKLAHAAAVKVNDPTESILDEEEYIAEHQPFPSLLQILQAVPEHVGFNIEIKWLCQLKGINVHTEDLLRNLDYIKEVKSKGLVLFCWGDDNNDHENRSKLKEFGVDGLVYDRAAVLVMFRIMGHKATSIASSTDPRKVCTTSAKGNSKVEEACEMYARAANMFKMAKNWNAAGSAFCQAAKLHMQLQSKHDSATSFVDAGNAYKKADPQEAINCLNAAIDIYTDMGRFTIAAKHHITIAEIYESELVDIEKAIAHYEQAADYYKGEESNSSANKCLLKVASYGAQLEQYQKAIEIYEQVGTNTMDNPLLKYSAKEYFFKAALCHFIVDELNAKLAVEKYEEMFPAFADSRECKLVKKLLDAHEEQNSEAFTEAVKEFDSVSRLDQWLTTMLLRLKKTIQGDAGDLK
ncbi:Beta-soluble NSF attachment protein [Acipenser ruthenus]|uniref:Beta-soluble NSF attachment protein n=1 Tax=Acipenser ruthenus TaxID=7906 RepID=A0A444TYG1_ACIRT|nr:Beta-soluble NSF attachment protein [Acipenser ruthenus]